TPGALRGVRSGPRAGGPRVSQASRREPTPGCAHFSARVAACKARIELVLERALTLPDPGTARLLEAMRYSVLGGGKRLRPTLVYLTGESLGAAPEALDAPAAAVELIHVYSLVHDDLPAMDDDDMRRGRPTCHRAYDEGTAVLVGDALQALAFAGLPDAPLGGPPAAPPPRRPPRPPPRRPPRRAAPGDAAHPRARARHRRHGRGPGDRPGRGR